MRLTATSTEGRENCAKIGERAQSSAVCAQEPPPHAEDPPSGPRHMPRYRLLVRPQAQRPPPCPAPSVEYTPLVLPHAPRTRPSPLTSRTEGPPPSSAPLAENLFPCPAPTRQGHALSLPPCAEGPPIRPAHREPAFSLAPRTEDPPCPRPRAPRARLSHPPSPWSRGCKGSGAPLFPRSRLVAEPQQLPALPAAAQRAPRYAGASPRKAAAATAGKSGPRPRPPGSAGGARGAGTSAAGPRASKRLVRPR